MERMNLIFAMKVFIEVVESGGFSAAARKLRIQQSTVSRTIGQLESEYNAVLLMRTTRKLALTEAGQAFLLESRRIVSELDGLSNRMKRIREEPRGTLRIGLSNTFGRLFIVPILPEFKSKYPEISLEVHLEDRLVDFMTEGYDVVIRVGKSDDTFITSRKIAVVRRGMFASKKLLRKLGPISEPADLERFPAILFEDRVPSNPKWILTQGRTKVQVPIHSVTCINQLDSICSLVQEGFGVAHVPLFLADSSGKASQLEQVLPDWSVSGDIEATTGVYALFLGGERVSGKVRAFVDHLIHHLGRLNTNT